MQQYQTERTLLKIDTRNHQQLLKPIKFMYKNDKRIGDDFEIDTRNHHQLLKLIGFTFKNTTNGAGLFF